jgi:uncharacterized protein (TIRG00374 family)
MTEETEVAQGIETLAEEAPSRSGWRLLENIVVLLLLGAGLYFLVPKFIGEKEMLEVVGNANFMLIPLCLVVETLSMLCVCRLYYEVLRLGGGELTFPRMSLIYMSAYAFGHVVPGGNAGTLYLNFREMRNERVPRALTAKTLAVAYIIYSAALIVLLAMGLLLSLFSGRLPLTYNLTAMTIAAGAVLFMLLCIYIFRRPRVLQWMAAACVGAAHRLRLMRGMDEREARYRVMELREYVLSVFSNRRNILRTGSFGLGFWLLDMTCLYIVFLALGHPINPGILMICYTIADVMGSLPLTPAGLGVFEISLGATLFAFGYQKEVLVLAILGFRFFSFWMCTLAGGICYLILRLARRRERLQGAVQEAGKP